MKATPGEVKASALDLYSHWQEKWSEANGDPISKDQWLEDLELYSPPTNEIQVTRQYDHDFYTIPVSVGDEAGIWTLYVVTPTDSVRVDAIWQVFDTMPGAVFERQTTGEGGMKWLNLP